jgi:hypothetical protein
VPAPFVPPTVSHWPLKPLARTTLGLEHFGCLLGGACLFAAVAER